MNRRSPNAQAYDYADARTDKLIKDFYKGNADETIRTAIWDAHINGWLTGYAAALEFRQKIDRANSSNH
jgi:hypothetical protein